MTNSTVTPVNRTGSSIREQRQQALNTAKEKAKNDLKKILAKHGYDFKSARKKEKLWKKVKAEYKKRKKEYFQEIVSSRQNNLSNVKDQISHMDLRWDSVRHKTNKLSNLSSNNVNNKDIDIVLPTCIVANGNLDYYKQRYEDFKIRNPGLKPPDYYLDYGDKYAQRFSKETMDNLSPEGKEWLIQTRINLQQAIENKVSADPKGFEELERNPDKFRDFAYDTHADAYWNAGLKDLPLKDLVQIGLTPDFSDLLTPSGVDQVFDILGRYYDHYSDELDSSLGDLHEEAQNEIIRLLTSPR